MQRASMWSKWVYLVKATNLWLHHRWASMLQKYIYHCATCKLKKNDMKRSKSGTPLTRCIFSFMESQQQKCDCGKYKKKYASQSMWRQQCYRKEKLSMNKTPSCTQFCDIDKMSNNHNKNNPNETELVKIKWKQDEKTVPSTTDDTIIKRLNTFDL